MTTNTQKELVSANGTIVREFEYAGASDLELNDGTVANFVKFYDNEMIFAAFLLPNGVMVDLVFQNLEEFVLLVDMFQQEPFSAQDIVEESQIELTQEVVEAEFAV